MISGEDIARFWAKVYKLPGDDACWEWTAQIAYDYGRFFADGSNWQAHRFSWTIENGDIPEGHQVHHKCENKRCVKPSHLDAVLPREHTVMLTPTAPAYKNARKTHCAHGHEFTACVTTTMRTAAH